MTSDDGSLGGPVDIAEVVKDPEEGMEPEAVTGIHRLRKEIQALKIKFSAAEKDWLEVCHWDEKR